MEAVYKLSGCFAVLSTKTFVADSFIVVLFVSIKTTWAWLLKEIKQIKPSIASCFISLKVKREYSAEVDLTKIYKILEFPDL